MIANGKIIYQNTNIFGSAGERIAYISLWIWGGGAWVVSFIFLCIGIFQIVKGQYISSRQLWSAVILFFSSCIILGTQSSIGQDWYQSLDLFSMGGVIGGFLGKNLCRWMLSTTGTLIIFIPLYLLSLIYFMGLTPLSFAQGLRQEFMAWRHHRKARKSLKETEKKESENRLEKQLNTPKPEKKSSILRSGDPLPDDDELGLFSSDKKAPLSNNTPAPATPQIIDASQNRARPITPGQTLFPAPENTSSPDYSHYVLPSFDLLHYEEAEPEQTENERAELLYTQQQIVDTLRSFDIDVSPGNITKGPTITRFEIYPSRGLRVAKISQVEADIALATKAERINILAPIPGKDTVGIEIANNKKVAVPLRELLQDPAFASPNKRIPIALGKDVYGNVVIGDLAAMPHLLVAGATGSGKSVCINSIISSILYKFRPDELRFILVDPKVVEMKGYAKLPHLIVPVVTDPKKVIGALRWSVNEMERRYRIFAEVGVRNFESFNKRPREEKSPETTQNTLPPDTKEEEPPIDDEFIEALASSIEGTGYEPAPKSDRGGHNSSYYEDEDDEEDDEIPDKFPYIVIIIDELADLMQTAPQDIEGYIARLTQKARAAGIHLIVATQSPRKDVVTGLIKANIPCRIAFQVSSALDSRIILDTGGAEKLVGKGDSLYLPPGSAKLERAQGAYISDDEVEALVKHCSTQSEQKFEQEIQEHIEADYDDSSQSNELSRGDEEALERCIELVRMEQKASTSLIQRRLKFGYGKAARLIDILEKRNIIGPSEGPSKAREVYIK